MSQFVLIQGRGGEGCTGGMLRGRGDRGLAGGQERRAANDTPQETRERRTGERRVVGGGASSGRGGLRHRDAMWTPLLRCGGGRVEKAQTNDAS